jgi:hypothetical protein
MSNKRILLAFILAGSIGFLGVHRLYAGRYLTGLLQLVLFTVGAAMLWRGLAGIQSLHTIDELDDWVLNHPVQPLPALLILIPSIWAVIDCGLLLARRFRDGAGELITRWI